MIEKWESNAPLKERVEKAQKVKHIFKDVMAKKKTKSFRENKSIKNVEYKILDKPLSTVYLHLNTKDAFKNMPNPPYGTRVKIYDDYTEEEPHRDSIYSHLKTRLCPIVKNK